MPAWKVRLLSEGSNPRESAGDVISALESWGNWSRESDGGIRHEFAYNPADLTTENDLDVSTRSIDALIERFFDVVLDSSSDDDHISISIAFDLDLGLPLWVAFKTYQKDGNYALEMSVTIPKGGLRDSDYFEPLIEFFTDIYLQGSFAFAKLHRDESEHLVSDPQDEIRSSLTAFQILSLGTVYELGIDELSVLDFQRTERLPDDSILLLVERRPTESSSKIREINESLGLD